MVPSPRHRFVAVLTATLLAVLGFGAFLPSTASAATTSLFNQPFHDATASGDGAVVLPKPVNDPNAACLTASGNTTVVPKSCTTTPTDTPGSGRLRLTDDSTYKVGGLFAAASVPTSKGLDLTFNTYQYGDRADNVSADGIAFALAAVDPTSPTAPANLGQNGGSLGYSGTNSGTKAGNFGLAYGYLGIGFDVYGNFSNNRFQGIDCPTPAYIANNTQIKSQVIVRGPGNTSAGYCPVASTATGTTGQPLVPLRARTRDASRVPVEVVINPSGTAVVSPSGIAVPAKGFAVQFTPVGAAAARTLSGALPVVSSSLSFPSTWLDAAGYPKQLAFGWVGSTGGSQDAHELDNVKVVSLSPVPELNVAQTAYSSSAPVAGDPVSYVVKAGVESGIDETSPVSVTDTLPTGVTPTGGFGSGWTCGAPSGQKITCTNSAVPVKAGASLPTLTITGTVTGSGVTSTTIQNNTVVTASSNDANPAYSSTAGAGTPTSAPSNLVITPPSGPTGSSVTVTGTGTANATAVQVGTATEIARGTATTLSPCPGNSAAVGCFTIDATTGAIGISSMPTHTNGAVQVKVVTLGAAAAIGFTYTSVPGTPTVTATAGPLAATATWDAPASGGSAITGYTVTPSRDGVAQTAVAVAAGVTSYTVGNATAGSSYTFTVSAKNSNGTGVASVQSNEAVPYTVPGAPTIGTASASTGSARLSWTAPTANGYSAVTGFVVTPYLNGTAQTPQTFASTATTQTVTDLVAGGSYTFTVAAVNAAGTGPASRRSAAVTVNDVPTITSSAVDGEVGVSYSQQLTVSGGTADHTYAVSDGALPAGLALSAGGRLSGTPTAAGSSTFTVKVTDASGVSSTKGFTVVVAAPVSLTFTPALPATNAGAPYSQPLSYAGGTGPYTFSVDAGSLPPGLSLDISTGVVSGTATRSGDYSFTVKVVDAFTQSDTRAASLAVRAVPGVPTLGTPSAGTSSAVVRWAAPADVGNSAITGYVVTPYLDGVAQAPLTAGASATRLTVTGLDAGSSYTFTVAAVNRIGTGPATARSAAVVPNPGPAITTVPGNGEVGVGYTEQLVSDGGTGVSTYALASGSLPAGLTLSATGLLSGTPTAAGPSTFGVRVTDEDHQSSSRTFTVVVAARPALTFSTVQPTGTVGSAYSRPLSHTGGTGPFTFAVGSGALPAGLTLDATTGVLSGTPTTSGPSSFAVTITDALGQSDTRGATLEVRDVPAPPAAPSVTAGTGAVKVAWVAPADGGSAITGYVVTPYVGSVALTPVVFSSTATTQTVTGLTPGTEHTFTVAAVNAIGTGPASARSAAVTVNGDPRISSTPAAGEVGAAYSQQLTVTGGTGPYTFDLTGGTLPAGLTLTGDGLLRGTPTADGASPVEVEVTDSYGASSTRTLTLVVVAAPSLTYTSPLPRATVGTGYRRTLTRTGGTGPFTFVVSAGTLPAGLTLDAATGVLSGTPTRSGDSTFTVGVVDALGQGDTRSTTVSVVDVPGAPVIGSITPSTTSALVAWTAPATDGNSAVSGYVVTPYLDGVAQPATRFAATATSGRVGGLVPGTTYTFTVAALNAVGTGPASSATAPVTLRDAPYFTSTPGGGEVGAAYAHQLTTDGGTGDVSFSVVSGAFPDGVTLSASGLLSGRPTSEGTSTVRLRVTDDDGVFTSRTFTIVVVPAPALTFDSPLADAFVGTPYSRPLGLTGGTGPFTFSISAGSLPAGLVLDPASGVVAGTATSAGNRSFTVQVVDALGQSAAKVGAIAVRGVPGAPAAVTAAAGTSAAQVSWTAPVDDGNSPVTGYVVTPYVDGVARPAFYAETTATTQRVTGLTAGTTYAFTVAATNAAGTGPESPASPAVTVNGAPSSTGPLGAAEVGAPYRQQLGSTGGTGNVAFTVSSGALPAGLTLSPGGLVSGTPTAAATSTFRIRVTDTEGATSTRAFTVVVAPAPELTGDAALPPGEVGRPYATDLTVAGGTGPFTFSVTEGSLPPGLALDPGTGAVAGTPTQGGAFDLRVRVLDARGGSASKSFTLLVKGQAVVTLSVSDTTVGTGSTVRLSAVLDPSSSTGSVSFAVTGPDGVEVDAGTDRLSGGRASVQTTLTAFGTSTVVATYAGDATHLAATSQTASVDVVASAGEAIITELRTSGPNGGNDSYVEIFNTGGPMPLAGFTLVSGSGSRTVLPADAPVLGKHRTYLVAGKGFSLGTLATPDLRVGSVGTGGFQVVAPDRVRTITDAVGPDQGLHLGRALPTLSGTPTDQWAFVRIEKAGRPVNTSQNGSDFALVSSGAGKVGGVQSMRGSASPTGLGDDWQHDDQAQSYLLDDSAAVDAVPNRAYVVGAPGTLEIRRTITNTGTSTITSAKARVTALSEADGLPYWGASQPAKAAAIRAVNPKTSTSRAEVKGRGTVLVQNLKVDAPITAAAGGGLNSTFTVALPDGGLAPGASVDVAFTFEVDVRGTFWFGYDVDAQTSASGLRTSGKTLATVKRTTVDRRLAVDGKQRSKAVAPSVRGTL